MDAIKGRLFSCNKQMLDDLPRSFRVALRPCSFFTVEIVDWSTLGTNSSDDRN